MVSNYWINREKLKLRKNLKDATRTTKRVRRNMDKARLEIESEIAKIFSKYAKDNKMTYADAIQMLTFDEFSEFKMDIVDYVSRIKASGSDELLRELNTLSAKARISRLESLFYQCNKILEEDYKFKTDEVRELMSEGVIKSFNHNVDSFSEHMGVSKALSYINPKVVSDIVNMPWSGKNYSSRLWNNKEKLMDKLEEQLTVAFIQGKDLRKISKELRDTFDVAKNVADRLINTEHAYACAQGDLKSYEEIGIKKYEYVATLDTRTSNICRKLDGRVFNLDEASPGLNFPPMHPHCRSTTIPYVTDIEDRTRIARDNRGKNIYVDSDMTYEQFHKKYVESDPEYSFKEKAWRNRHSDRKQFQKYKKLGFDEIKSFDKFQDMKYNDIKEWNMVKGYGKSVQNGEISPLIKYSNFKEHHNDLKNNLVGLKFSDGTEIKDISYHFTARAIGTHDWANANNSKETMKRLNHKHVPTKDIIDCIKNGKLIKHGDSSIVYEKKRVCGLSLNPKTGVIIQCNPK